MIIELSVFRATLIIARVEWILCSALLVRALFTAHCINAGTSRKHVILIDVCLLHSEMKVIAHFLNFYELLGVR